MKIKRGIYLATNFFWNSLTTCDLFFFHVFKVGSRACFFLDFGPHSLFQLKILFHLRVNNNFPVCDNAIDQTFGNEGVNGIAFGKSQ